MLRTPRAKKSSTLFIVPLELENVNIKASHAEDREAIEPLTLSSIV